MPIAQSDRQRRLQVFNAISAAALLALVGYSIVNLNEGDTTEMWTDVTLAAMVAGCVIAVRAGVDERTVYRVFLGGMAIGLGVLVAIGAGSETALYYPLMLPILLFFFLGRVEGGVAAITFLLCMAVLVLLPSLTATYPYELGNSLRFLVAYGLLTLIGWSYEAARHRFEKLLLDKNRQLERDKHQLQDALSQIKTLKGLIPICSSCHRIRNDDGYWQHDP